MQNKEVMKLLSSMKDVQVVHEYPIYKTREYHRFKGNPLCRQRNDKAVKKIKKGIAIRGSIINPILVTVDDTDGKYVIFRGLQQFYAIQELGETVYFCVISDAINPEVRTLLNKSKNWSSPNFIYTYAKSNESYASHYANLVELSEKYNLSPLIIAAISEGAFQSGGGIFGVLKSTTFRMDDIKKQEVDNVLSIILTFRPLMERFCQKHHWPTTLAWVYNQHLLDFELLRKALDKYAKVTKSRVDTIADIIYKLEECYNKMAKTPVPLTHYYESIKYQNSQRDGKSRQKHKMVIPCANNRFHNDDFPGVVVCDTLVYKTSSYDNFKLHPQNRDIDDKHVKNLMKSFNIKQYICPIIINEKGEIIDGQHRYFACKALGLPIYFIIIPGLDYYDILVLNCNSTNYSLDDYLGIEIANNNVDICNFMKLVNEFPWVKKQVIAALIQQTVYSDKMGSKLRTSFVCSDTRYKEIYQVLSELQDLLTVTTIVKKQPRNKVNPDIVTKFGDSKNLILIIGLLLQIPEIDKRVVEYMLTTTSKEVNKHIHKAYNVEDMLDVLQKCYHVSILRLNNNMRNNSSSANSFQYDTTGLKWLLSTHNMM